MKDQSNVLVRNAGEGEQRWFAGGGLFTMKATAAETGGALTMFVDHVVRGKTTPLHKHTVDELIYVLAGTLRVHVDGAEHVVSTGGMFYVPPGVPHAFLVISETAELLCVQTPGAGEAFFRSVSDPSTSAADAARPPDIARLQEGAMRAETIELLGPPPF